MLEYDASLHTSGLYHFRDGPFQALNIPDNAAGSWDFDRVGGSAPVSISVKYRSINYDGFSFGLICGVGNMNGQQSRRNSLLGVGTKYDMGEVPTNVLYTNTRNTLTSAEINTIEIGANWRITPEWSFGGNYQYMKGDAELLNNKAHDVTASLTIGFRSEPTSMRKASISARSAETSRRPHGSTD